MVELLHIITSKRSQRFTWFDIDLTFFTDGSAPTDADFDPDSFSYSPPTSAIAMAKNPIHHQKTRHISRKFHFIREAIQAKEIELIYCKTEDQIADILTKALPKDHFVSLRSLLGVKTAKGLEGSVGM
ncbi:hypothetical protein L3X38_009592 [Prunus dulcis]|uniref:Uncharacterized protein n=1 Tax=Prunus dulcis TaxID=3755 RepID=A0AAD4WGL6_PRUDU|nr:hypothetical protein L3X38_009592 [Prunus dulcis]